MELRNSQHESSMGEGSERQKEEQSILNGSAMKMAQALGNSSSHSGVGISITAVGFLGIRRGFMSQLLFICIVCFVVIHTTRHAVSVTMNYNVPVQTEHFAAVQDVYIPHDAQPFVSKPPLLPTTNNLHVAIVPDATRVAKLVSVTKKSASDVSKPTTATSPVSEKLDDHIVIQYEGFSAMHALMARWWKGSNPVCNDVFKARKDSGKASQKITVNLTISCKELFDKANCGTGNVIQMLYGIRLASSVVQNFGLQMTCSDAEETKEDLVVPWLMGHFSPRSPSAANPYPMVKPSEACAKPWSTPIAYMYKEMRHDFRRMAIELVGIPGPDHPSAHFVENTLTSVSPVHVKEMQLSSFYKEKTDPVRPMGANFEVDDAIIHFRCGDLMNSDHPNYGFMTFSGYTRLISKDARSIGILTSPFDPEGQIRPRDASELVRERCRIVVTSLVEYIQERFPAARLRVHNDATETVAVTYSRIIMANQTIVGISSFSVFPAIGSFGTGYLLKPDPHGPNKWTTAPDISSIVDNVVIFEEPSIISVIQVRDLWKASGKEAILDWFWNGTKPDVVS